MKEINWNKALSVNIEEIDIQHKNLIDIINNLSQNIQKGVDSDYCKELIDKLEEYSKYHFRTEEELFEKYNYPESEKHIFEHTLFIEKVDFFRKSFNDKLFGLEFRIFNFLHEWLVKHILNSDKKYSEYLNNMGVK